MRGEYEPDKFTEADVLRELDLAGLRYKQGHRYILSQCPTHEDKHPSVQIYKDDWFVNCHAGCGRYHITKAFPSLREHSSGSTQSFSRPVRAAKKEPEVKYKAIDLMEFWKSLPEIPEDHYFKNIPIDELNSLGWRWDAEHNRYFIPYFSRSKKSIPFGQWRNLQGNVRFNFWKDAKPTMYGTWNLEPGEKIFLVEGCSDAAVLEYCSVPWIATPSASQPELVKAMAKWAAENRVELVYAGLWRTVYVNHARRIRIGAICSKPKDSRAYEIGVGPNCFQAKICRGPRSSQAISHQSRSRPNRKNGIKNPTWRKSSRYFQALKSSRS